MARQITDPAAGIVYVQGPPWNAVLTPPATWGSFPLDGAAQDGLSAADVVRIAPAAELGEPVAIGLTDIDGTPVMAYEITFDGDEVEELAGDTLAVPDLESLGDVVELATLRYYVTQDNRIVRTTSTATSGDVESGRVTVTIVTDVTGALDPAFVIGLPDPATVQPIDLAQLDAAEPSATTAPVATSPVATSTASTAPPATAVD